MSDQIREQIEALRREVPFGNIEPADAWEHGFNDCLNAVLEVVSPVCPQCDGSGEHPTERRFRYVDETDRDPPEGYPIPCPSCQGDREADDVVTVRRHPAFNDDMPQIVELPEGDREARDISVEDGGKVIRTDLKAFPRVTDGSRG